VLLVLHREAYRAFRLFHTCASEKRQEDFESRFVSSHFNADSGLDLLQIFSWWKRVRSLYREHVREHLDVCVEYWRKVELHIDIACFCRYYYYVLAALDSKYLKHKHLLPKLQMVSLIIPF
jgi:hypothetical protein